VWKLVLQDLLPTLMGSISPGVTPPIYIILRLQIVEVPVVGNNVNAAINVGA
jgi:hypothetical protein